MIQNADIDITPPPTMDGTFTRNGRGAIKLPPPEQELEEEKSRNEDALKKKVENILLNARNRMMQGGDGVEYTVRSMSLALAEYVSPKPSGLPPIKKLGDFVASPPATPLMLIDGILHQGSKMVLGGGSKSFKTWSLIDLGLSVAAGEKWWGFQTMKKKVLYVNMEIQEGFFFERTKQVCAGKLITNLPEDNFHIWNLRGFATNLDTLLPQILASVKEEGYGLIILDPIYKLYGERDENAAGDVASLMNGLEKIAVESGAAIVFGAHFAKGNASAKEAIDRVAGSGVFARDPDSIVNLTKHEEDDCYTCDMILRNFAPVKPCVLKWQFPMMVRQDKLDPKKLKGTGGCPERFNKQHVLLALTEPLTSTEWYKAVKAETGMSERQFYSLKKELEEEGLVITLEATKKWIKKTDEK